MIYYNEIDPKAAAWLRELMDCGFIPQGEVDERSIVNVHPDDLRGFTQCHFFAGIGGWSRALEIAQWPIDKPVWTGSCPCQPFSNAGAQLAENDPRHLWPAFFHLINIVRPPVVAGEQVASKLGREWLAGVRADLEGVGYAVGGADLCAAGVGAPHIRQRLYWVACADSKRRAQRPKYDRESLGPQQQASRWDDTVRCGVARRLADADGGQSGHGGVQCGGEHGQQPENGGVGGVGHADMPGCKQQCRPEPVSEKQSAAELRGNAGNFWSAYDLLPCTDGKARRIEPGSFPLVAGIPRGVVPVCDPSASYAQASAEGRVARLRGYGNSIVPELAARFIISAEEAFHAIQ